MSEIRRKLKKDFDEGRKVIERVREDRIKFTLESGQHWIPTVRGIPIGTFTTEELKELLKEAKYKIKDENLLDNLSVLDLYESRTYTARELIKRFNI